MLGISVAYAQAAGGSAGNSTADLLMNLVPFIVLLVVAYFLILRPQQQRAKDHTKLISNVRRGDIIVTSGGMVGKVTKATDDKEVEVEIAVNVRVRIVRSMIAEVRSKGEPVKEGS